MAVGRSTTRTPAKHDLLNAILGREAAVMSRTFLADQPWTILDLCAGDGNDDDSSGTSSPKIIAKHAREAAFRGTRVNVVLVEKNRATYEKLSENIAEMDFGCRPIVKNADSRATGVVPFGLWGNDSPVFVHNDPNTVNDFALNGELTIRLPRFTTTLSTLGCNAGGLKRLPREDRQGWYEHVERVLSIMPEHHDAKLITLNGDDSQWAYLLTGPSKWRDKYDANAAKAFSGWPKGITAAWYKTEATEFHALCDELFLTGKERVA